MTQPSENPVEITLETTEEVTTPLGEVATVMAALIDQASGVEAHATGTRIFATADGVTVTMAVLSVSADAEDVLSD